LPFGNRIGETLLDQGEKVLVRRHPAVSQETNYWLPGNRSVNTVLLGYATVEEAVFSMPAVTSQQEIVIT
jgi:hypothetical protein